ncbi:type 1 glutamine amidotransferase domain-containing protein [Chryseolinea lacunae]|uniref:Type 1 glutamine amidotransferase domain-containing protein n=1 Tax=Chryseolinea lacunae TaxID=2801331 RepID=A0ABS1KRM4_9BACT|nr:type 1 glutamine amidotransferase domain-containing protein [Chryseolinea lacunae]MBL0740931.1 type 1 glutamine amidotransferase domain-containing protein [Chryseolinea lacunae]
MKHTSILASALLLALAWLGHTQSTSNTMSSKVKTSTKVLFVVTSASEVKTNGKKTGLWLEEFTTPYYALTDEGFEVVIASPAGGKAPIDPKSTAPAYVTPSVTRFFDDRSAQDQLDHTRTLSDVRAEDYAAIFYPGGHGPMWDLPDNALSIRLLETFHRAGKPVALVCHAPAALKNVKAQNGEPLVKGKQVTGYTNSEERAGQSTDVVPFLLEDMLKEKGAHYVHADDWQPFVVTDGTLITGQNPASAHAVASKLSEILKTVSTAKK